MLKGLKANSQVYNDYLKYVGTSESAPDYKSRKFVKYYTIVGQLYPDMSCGASDLYFYLLNKISLYKMNVDNSLYLRNQGNPKMLEAQAKLREKLSFTGELKTNGELKEKNMRSIVIDDVTRVGNGALYNYPLDIKNPIIQTEHRNISPHTITARLTELEEYGLIEVWYKDPIKKNGRMITILMDLSKPTEKEIEAVYEYAKEHGKDMSKVNKFEVKDGVRMHDGDLEKALKEKEEENKKKKVEKKENEKKRSCEAVGVESGVKGREVKVGSEVGSCEAGEIEWEGVEF